jgi:EPS-associated MarR family transcriptional regulator
MPRQANSCSELPEAHFRVMRALEADPHSSQRKIAKAAGISLGAVNYCLSALAEKGFVKAKNFRAADNKFRYAYFLTPKGVAEKAALMRVFLERKLTEYEALKAEIEALESEAANEIQGRRVR